MKLLGQPISASELKALLHEASLEDLLARVSSSHEVHFETVRLGDEVLEFLQITDMPAYIDCRLERSGILGGIDALPLWAKIWPASLPLAMFMQRQTPRPGERILEIGAGVGVVGLFAARRDFPVVLSDNNPDALLFARINVLRNKLAHMAETRLVDFASDVLQERFPRIVASEVLYQEALYDPLLGFLRTHLQPRLRLDDVEGSGEILLSADEGRRSLKFFLAARDHFHIARSVFVMPREAPTDEDAMGDHQTHPHKQRITIYRMRPK